MVIFWNHCHIKDRILVRPQTLLDFYMLHFLDWIGPATTINNIFNNKMLLNCKLHNDDILSLKIYISWLTSRSLLCRFIFIFIFWEMIAYCIFVVKSFENITYSFFCMEGNHLAVAHVITKGRIYKHCSIINEIFGEIFRGIFIGLNFGKTHSDGKNLVVKWSMKV